MKYVATCGRQRVRIVERDLGGAESVFYVGKDEVRVELRYDADAGISRYECDEHGTRDCGHVRLVRAAVRAASARPVNRPHR
jgi:hypothetical protein